MKKIRLLIADDDREYAQALARQITFTRKDFTVMVWTELSGEADALSCHLLLAEECEKGGAREKYVKIFQQRGGYVCLARERKEGESAPWVLRFERVSRMVSMLQLVYAKSYGERKVEINFSGVTRLVGFIDVSETCSGIWPSVTFARLLAREQRKKTLYLSFRELSSVAFAFRSADSSRSLGDFLYYLFSRSESKAATYVDSFLFQDECGLFSFYPSRWRNELAGLSQEELICFFSILIKYGEFDHIVLDLPCSFRPEALFLMRSCNTLALLYNQRPYSLFLREQALLCLEEYTGLREEIYCLASPEEGEDCSYGEICLHGPLGREMMEFAKQLTG